MAFVFIVHVLQISLIILQASMLEFLEGHCSWEEFLEGKVVIIKGIGEELVQLTWLLNI